jgi:hypothetical protein
MSKELYEWLKNRFKFDNHPKYLKYFKEWIDNLSVSQIDGFDKQMNIKLTESMHLKMNCQKQERSILL